MMFSVNDRVRVTKRDMASYNWGPGTIYEITNYGGITVNFDNGEVGLLFEDELELY